MVCTRVLTPTRPRTHAPCRRPKTVYNAQRRSVVGFSADFLAFNLIKHASYAAYNFALFWSVAVQRQYRDAHGQDAPIPVTGADVAYSAVSVEKAHAGVGSRPSAPFCPPAHGSEGPVPEARTRH